MKTELRNIPQPPPSFGVASLLDDAWRLERFTPPFAFGEFFSPEDTLLCVCAAESARELLAESGTAVSETGRGFRVTELTSGSGLVGLYLLGRDSNARLLGLDINAEAARLAERNAAVLGLADRASFAQSDLWSPSTLKLLEAAKPQMIVCNPPYVPEPPGTRMQIEAGAGPNGTAHLLRALELTKRIQPDTLALSWCSLSDPAGVAAAAEACGYELCALYVTAIADGEYSGSVHSYLQDLSDCFINSQSETLALIAPDGSARFVYLLLAGTFRRMGEEGGGTRDGAWGIGEGAKRLGGGQRVSAVASVDSLCRNFARDGVTTLASARAPFPLRCSVLTRWDELSLRVMLHGQVARWESAPAALASVRSGGKPV